MGTCLVAERIGGCVTSRPSARNRAVTGTVAGFVLRLTRESIPLTQTGMAEALGIDLGTVQGRESGRRPLANMKAGAFLDLKRRLLTLGADRTPLGLLDAAMDADRIIGAALDPSVRLELHPLAGWVHTRDTAHMIAWAVDGAPPPALRRPSPSRRGPVATAPLMARKSGAPFSRICGTLSKPLPEQVTVARSFIDRRGISPATTAAQRPTPGLRTPSMPAGDSPLHREDRRVGRRPVPPLPPLHAAATRCLCWTLSTGRLPTTTPQRLRT